MNKQPSSLFQNAEFRSYLGSSALTGAAQAMQQLLFSWLLVGILLLPADQVGIIQALIGIPGIILLLWGGASADKTDPRGLLMKVYGVAWLFPLALLASIENGYLNIWTVSCFGLAMSTAISFSNPAQQAILSRVTSGELQRGVTAASAIGFIVQIGGLFLAGQMEVLGVGPVLLVQSGGLFLGVFAIKLIKPMPMPITRRESTWTIVLAGLHAAYRNKTVRQTLAINFLSSIFNAGAFMTAIPFIVKRIYGGDALGLATIMIVFYGGATISNLVQFKIMPLARPGLWFLAMQLTRMIIIYCLWLTPQWWLLMLVLFAWGINMGATTSLSRALVQESAEPEYLARVLSIYNLAILGSMPIGALILGFVIEAFGTMDALIPAMLSSGLLGMYGFLFTDVWKYRSPGSK